ncbi:MAG: DUF882 domain-containing protein [Polyangiales bacterium]
MSRWSSILAASLLVTAPLVAIVGFPSFADGAEVTHVVEKGDKIDDLAKKYGVTVKAIASANKLKDPTHLKAGTKLVIPGAKANKSFEGKPKHPGRVTFVRFGTQEKQELQLVTKKGKIVPGALPRMARVMRFAKLNIEHPVDPRLLQLVAQVSDHFGGRTVEIVSGFRPKTPTQYTPHSNHNVGRAIDMRVTGVPNEVLRDHCRTYKNVGVGYYPNSLFVHFDVRAKSTFWVDLSKPGEAPKYLNGQGDFDHALDDAAADGADLQPKDELASGAPSSSAPPPLPPLPPAGSSSAGQK